MNLSTICIERPVATTLISLALVIFGIISYFTLPINDLPTVDFPTISVTASLPGASPETMAAVVAAPLESRFTAIAGVDSMSSVSLLGTTYITVTFNLDRDIDGAAQDIQAAIAAARPFLPKEMPTPPVFSRVNPADAPIYYISLTSATLPIYRVNEYAETVLAPRISMVSGVAQVQMLSGALSYSPHVKLDPRKLASYGIGIDEVTRAIRASNVNRPTGTLYGTDKSYVLRVNGQLMNAKDFRSLIIAYRDGQPVRISDIGQASDSVQDERRMAWFNGDRAVVLAVSRQPNTNTVQIVDHIKKLMPSLRAALPPSVKATVYYDRSRAIRESIVEIEGTLALTVGLVIMVMILFMGNLSASLIASIVLPVSIIGTFAAMKLFGFSLNNISLMALIVCAGFLVDDSVVVLENVIRHMEVNLGSLGAVRRMDMRKRTVIAALSGSNEITFTVQSMTVSLIAVFIPILFLGGIIGRLFFEFAATICTAVLISGIASLSLTPMLCSRLLQLRERSAKRTLFNLLSDTVLGGCLSIYQRSLQVALRYRAVVLGLSVALVAVMAYLLYIVPKGFLPNVDTGMVIGRTEAAQGISFDDMIEHQLKINQIVGQDPNVENYVSSIGSGGRLQSTANNGVIVIGFKPYDKRKSVEQTIDGLRKATAGVPGIKLFLQPTPAVRLGGMSTKGQYQLSLTSTNSAKLFEASGQIFKRMKDLPEITDVNTDLQIKNLQYQIEFDRDKLARCGVTMRQAQDALNSAYSGRQVSVIYTPTNQYWVILEVAPEFDRDLSSLSLLRIRSKDGQLVPLSAVSTFKRTVGPLSLTHIGQFPSVTISFNLKSGTSLGPAVAHIKEVTSNVLPEGVSSSFQGAAQQFETALSNMGELLIIAVLIIYIVLGCLYESFIQPVTILSGLPAAGIGAILALLVFHLPLDVYAFLGLILLIGIVKKNGIMMVDFAVEAESVEGLSAEAAIYKACVERFRPIMMTTLCALMGSLPLALNGGQFASSRQPLGLAIVGGLLVSQLVTLYMIPILYIYFSNLQHWLRADLKRPSTRTTVEVKI